MPDLKIAILNATTAWLQLIGSIATINHDDNVLIGAAAA